MWRYRPLLPLAGMRGRTAAGGGWTPLYDTPRLADRSGTGAGLGKGRWSQSDRFAQGSRQRPGHGARDGAGHEVITTASTGNAAAALAGLTASVGMPAAIFVPASAPEAKIAQLLTYGAKVLLVQGNYDMPRSIWRSRRPSVTAGTTATPA